jgi:hypothetical protein
MYPSEGRRERTSGLGELALSCGMYGKGKQTEGKNEQDSLITSYANESAVVRLVRCSCRGNREKRSRGEREGNRWTTRQQ